MISTDFSIIIPVYNASKTILKISKQLLNNNLNLELLLVNDGSIDSSLKVCRKIAASDKRVKVINQVNSGPSVARNTGIKHSKGDFIIFCDADDEIINKNFELILKNFKKSPSDMLVIGWGIIQKKHGKILRKSTINLKKQNIPESQIISKTIKSIGDDGRMYNLWNKIYRAKIIRDNNLVLREDLKFGEDLLFNFDFLKFSKNIQITNEAPYYIYEENSPTSIVSESKINYDFRKKNSEALDEFSKLSNRPEDKEMSTFVKWRWLISYCMAISSSNKNFKQKHTAIKAAITDNNLTVQNKNKKLTRRQLMIEMVFYVLSKSPLFFTLFTQSISIIKKIRSQKVKVTKKQLDKI